MSMPTALLGDVAVFIRGITFKPDDVVQVFADDSVICMRTKNVQAFLDCDDLLAVPSEFVRRKDQYLEEGDILVSSANSWNLVGKCCWIPSLPWRAAFGGFISVLRGNPNLVDRRYLYWWFASDRIQALLRSFGQKTTNISNLNIGRCLQLEMPLPAIPEQRRIAAILDQADALRAKRREALAQLDSLTQSIFMEMFGDPETNPMRWPERVLSELVRTDDSINYGVVQPGEDHPGGVPLIRVGDLVNGHFELSTLKTISPIVEAAYKRSRLRGDEVLVSCVGSIGVVVLATTAMTGFNIARAVARIPASESIDRIYLANYLRTAYVQRYFASELRIVSQPTLNIKQIAQTQVLSPPLIYQQAFATRIQAVEALKTQHRAALTELDALFASLQHRAFQGAL
jgi:type I restriction enzyme, S subunit